MITWQTSSTEAHLPKGLVSYSLRITDEFSSSVNPAILYIFVFKNEDDTQLTLTQYRASSSAIDFVIFSTAAFDMQYEIRPGCGLEPFKQEMFTTHP